MKTPKTKTEDYVTNTKFTAFEKRFELTMASIAHSFERIENTLATMAETIQIILTEHREFKKSLNEHA